MRWSSTLNNAWLLFPPHLHVLILLPSLPTSLPSLGTEILVPLTQSLYVPGTTSEADKVGGEGGREGGRERRF